MHIIVSLLALAYLLFAGQRWLRKQWQDDDPAVRRRATLRVLMVLIVVIPTILAITGRLHWLGVLIAAMVPVSKYLFSLAFRFLPFFLSSRAKGKEQTGVDKSSNDELDREEALKVLGLEADASEEAIIEAHRKLIQKCHPDRGGSDYLAARINLAKKILLEG